MLPLRPSLAGLLLLWFATYGCAKGDPLTPEALKTAQALWQQHNLTSYSVSFKIDGNRIESGKFDIVVDKGDIVKAARNGENLATTDTFYTVKGLFEFLAHELELASEPARYFGAPADARVYLRAHFDPKLGYPTRYLRSVVGTKHQVTVEIVSFTPN